MKLIGKLAAGLATLSVTISPVFAQSPEWQRQVSRIIASKQTYPRTAQMRGEEGTARVKIFVGSGGAIERTELVAPSGSTSLDKEAMAMPTRAGTVPPPPGGATSLILPLTWKLL